MDFFSTSRGLAAPRSFQLRRILLGASLLTLGLAACKKDPDTGNPPGSGTVLYVENNLAAGNGILAYRQQADGSLAPLPGSPFATGGTGFANTAQSLGPDDSDEALTLSADKKRLFAVNQGSNTISVFNIGADGALTPVSGSPFPSGGLNPCSLGLANGRLYVINKSDDGDPATTDPAPTYAVFDIGADGKLTALAGATVTTKPGATPSHALVSPSQRLLFVDDFLAFRAPAPQGTLRAFAIGADGRLTAAPGTPLAVPPDAQDMPSGALGLWSHPTQNILYLGIPMQSKVAVYSYDGTSGALTFRTTVDSGIPGPPNGGTCWLRVNKAGTRLYTLNSGEATVSVFDLTTPLAPTLAQTFALKSAGPLFGTIAAGNQAISSQPFSLTFSPDEKSLFIVSQHSNPDYTTNYNYLHVLSLASGGQLTEPTGAMQLPVPATARPQGAVSLTL